MLSRILTEERSDTMEAPYLFATPDSKPRHRKLSSRVNKNGVFQTPDVEGRTRSFITTPLNPDIVHEKSGMYNTSNSSKNHLLLIQCYYRKPKLN